MTTLPEHKSIVVVDIDGSTKRTNPIKAEQRGLMYQFVEEALDVAGIEKGHRDPYTDYGDGLLVLIHANVPKPLLIHRLIPTLDCLVRTHNDKVPATEQLRTLRLRVAIHAGEVLDDGKGYFGEDLDVAFRLLNATRFKDYLRSAAEPVVLIVSEDIYRSVVQHGYDGIDSDKYSHLVNVTVKARRRRGWVYCPGNDGFRDPPLG